MTIQADSPRPSSPSGTDASTREDIYTRSRLVVAFLHAIPERVRSFRSETITLREKLGTIREALNLTEAAFLAEIAAEKAAFPNEQSRKAELTRRLEASDDVISLRHEERETESAIRTLEAEIERLDRQFRAYLAEKDLLVCESNLRALVPSGSEALR